MHIARIAVLPAIALALSACTRILPWDEDGGADVAETGDASSDEYGTDSESGGLPDLPAETETSTSTETGTEASSTDDTDDTTDTGSDTSTEPGYCCTCEDGCWLSPSEVECVGFGEWHAMDSCEVTPASEIDCGLECDPPPAACCTCPDLTTPEYEFQCWAWVEGVEACVIAQANGLGEATHWCELDSDGYPTDCLDAC
jgi:hypothetical protein